MKSVSQKVERKQATEEKKRAKAKTKIVLHSLKHGVFDTSIKYKEHPSNIKRWRKQYTGDWRSLLCKSRRPHSHPKQHTLEEESLILETWTACGHKGIDYAYVELCKLGYKRTLWGLYHALRRLGLVKPGKKKGRRNYRQCTLCEIPGEKIQIDVKQVPSSCIRGKHKQDEKNMYQWTAIDECTRIRFTFGYEEHTPENSVDFLNRFLRWFPFEVHCIQTDNGTEFTYTFISDTVKCPFELRLAEYGIIHKLIKPRTPWHNGKVERSHRMDQRYFYDWESFRNMSEYNEKLADWLDWTNNKPMRIFKGKSPAQVLESYMWLI